MIDVIVPVYNTPKIDLLRCLDSIYNSTYKNIKVYIIDDGSEEKTKIILENYCKNKDNFILKHIKNSGVSSARNYGLNISNSKYFCFIDSDDTISKNFFEEAYTLMEKKNLDIIIGGYNEIVDTKISKIRKCDEDYIEFNKDTLVLFFDKLSSSKNTEITKSIGNAPIGRIYSRLFRRSTVKNIRFHENISLSEDTLYMINICDIISKVGICSKIWYNYYINKYSLSHKSLNLKKYLPFIEEIYKLILIENNPVKNNALKMRLFKVLNYIYNKSNNLNIIDDKYIHCINDVNISSYINLTKDEIDLINIIK